MNVDNIRRILRALEKRGMVADPKKAFQWKSNRPVYMVDRLVFALVQMLASELGDCFPMVSLREPDEEVEEEEILVQGDKALSIFKEIITLSQELVEPFTEGPFINQAE